jgi:molybdopterin converting factor small subunit
MGSIEDFPIMSNFDSSDDNDLPDEAYSGHTVPVTDIQASVANIQANSDAGHVHSAGVDIAKLDAWGSSLISHNIHLSLPDNALGQLVKITGQTKEQLDGKSLEDIVQILINEVVAMQKVEARLQQVEYLLSKLASTYPDFKERLSEVECL